MLNTDTDTIIGFVVKRSDGSVGEVFLKNLHLIDSRLNIAVQSFNAKPLGEILEGDSNVS